jgi:hypothetical protein
MPLAFDKLQEGNNDIEDLDAYGIDWEELHDTNFMAHHAEHDSDHELNPHACDHPFSNEGLHQLSHVEVNKPLCPFSLDNVAPLNTHLALNPHSQSHNMNSRCSVRIDALSFCRNLYNL